MKHYRLFRLLQISQRPLRQMRKDLLRRRLGKKLLALLGLLLLSSCRDSVPPKIEICILDGTGGGDCVEADGTQLHKTPMELLNYWATNQADEANFSSWCYDASKPAVQFEMDRIYKKATE